MYGSEGIKLLTKLKREKGIKMNQKWGHLTILDKRLKCFVFSFKLSSAISFIQEMLYKIFIGIYYKNKEE